MSNNRDVIHVDPQPISVETPTPAKFPVIVAKTVNLTINVARGAAEPLRRRYHRHYHPRHRFGRHHLVADIALALGVIALLGVNAYFFFWRDQPVPSKVKLSWSAESTEVRSGDRVTFALAYRYEGNEELRDATIALDVPGGLTVESVTPGTYDMPTRTIRVGTIAPGAASRVEIYGYTDAPDGTTLRIGATFHGKGATTSERTITTGSISVRGIAIGLTLFPWKEVRPEHSVILLSTMLTSEAARSWPDLTVTPELSAGLELRNDHLPSGATIPATIHNLTAGPGPEGPTFPLAIGTTTPGTYTVRFRISRAGDRGASETIGVIEQPFTVSPYPVALTLTRESGDAVQLGDEVSVRIQGTFGDLPIYPDHTAAIGVQIAGALTATTVLRGTGLKETGAGHSTVSSGFIRWPIPLEAKTGDVHIFSVRVPRSIDALAEGDASFAYTLTPVLLIDGELNRESVGVTIEGKPLVIPLSGQLKLVASARYFTPEGDQIGRGPIPPRVGQTTKYWVTWDAESVIEASDRVVVRAVIPDGVEWTGKTAVTAGDRLAFDQATRTVTWAIGALERASGDVGAATASFELAVIPRAEQAGSAMPILGKAVIGGEGRATKAALRTEVPAVTTNLIFDQRAKGKGNVTR